MFATAQEPGVKGQLGRWVNGNLSLRKTGNSTPESSDHHNKEMEDAGTEGGEGPQCAYIKAENTYRGWGL